MDKEGVEPSAYQEKLNAIASENAKNGRSDGMAWPLYLLKKHGLSVDSEVAIEIFQTEDCVAILSLYILGEEKSRIVNFADRLKGKSLYERDQYWLLLYQLFKDGHIENPYGDGVFDILKNNNVDFVPDEGHYNLAQQYCDYINNPFLEEEEKLLSFSDWILAAK